MEKFIKGFREGDSIQRETDRYVEVKNGYQSFIVSDSGQRKLFTIENGRVIFENKLSSGELSLNQIRVKRTAIITATRYYYKTVEVEVEIPNNISDEDIENYLTEDNDVDSKIEQQLSEASLNLETTEYSYQIPHLDTGGTL